jgi:hypothetical protein
VGSEIRAAMLPDAFSGGMQGKKMDGGLLGYLISADGFFSTLNSCQFFCPCNAFKNAQVP